MSDKDAIFQEDDDDDDQGDDGGGGGGGAGPGIDPFADADVNVDPTEEALSHNVAQQPPAPSAAAAASADFDPFAEVQTQSSDAASTEGMSRTAPGSAAAAGALEDEADPNLAPGSRKDLWPCPHCGARNKPGRDTCRSCGKSPEEAVISPLWKRPSVLVGAVLGVVLLVLLLAMLGGESFERRPAGAQSIDDHLRLGSASTGAVDLPGEQVFEPLQRIAVSGRIVHVDRSQYADLNTQSVIIAIGDRERINDPDFFNRLNPRIGPAGTGFDVRVAGDPLPGEVDVYLLHLLDPQDRLPELEPRQYLSLSGRSGRIAEIHWTQALEPGEHVILVAGELATR